MHFMRVKNVTIYGIAGSYAETYANENSIQFVATNFTYNNNGNGACTITGYIGASSDVIIPDTLEGLTVVEIADYAFDSEQISSIQLPSQLERIGIMAFFNTNIQNVTVPASVTEIGVNAFGNCYSLTAINVDASNINYASVDGVLFDKDIVTLETYPIGNSRVTYTIPDGVETIRMASFQENRLSSVSIPESI